MDGVSISGISGGYNLLVDAIIRPPRLIYDIEDLGPKKFTVAGRQIERNDLELKNERGLILRVSHYEPTNRPRAQMPCVIYLHGNCGCRLDAVDCLKTLVPLDITLVSLDFSGSGISEGEYVSLGFFEKDDLSALVTHLRQTGSVSTIGLWGRSMGAATSLLYGASDPSVACMVLDSPFTSLTTVAKELVEGSQVKIPKMMVSLGLKMIRKTILSKAKFDINKLAPIEAAESCFIPVLFVHGESDTFIPPHHSKEINTKYAGDKNLILVEGDHNSARPKFFYDSVSIFFHNMLLSPEEQEGLKSRKEEDASPKFQHSKPFLSSGSLELDGSPRPYEPSLEELEEEMLRQALMLSLQESQGVVAPELEVSEKSPPSSNISIENGTNGEGHGGS